MRREGAARAARYSGRLRRLRRLAAGDAGAGPAAALAVVALLCALIATAGPRLLVSMENAALRQILAGAGPLDRSVSASASWIPQPGASVSAGQVAAMGRTVGASLPASVVSPPGERWAALTGPPETVRNPSPRAVIGGPPQLELGYRTGVLRYATMVSGSLPVSATLAGPPHHRVMLMQAAVSAATAARFALRAGSRIQMDMSVTGYPLVLQVTGVFRAARPDSAFWAYDPLLASPQTAPLGHTQIWQGAVLIGAGALQVAEAAYTGDSLRLFWDYPVDTGRLTAADVSPVLSGLTGLAGGPAGLIAVQQAGAPLSGPLTIQNGIAVPLGTFAGRVAAVAEIDSLTVIGIFAVALILLLVSAVTLAGAHGAELALVRARGGSARQVAALMAGRAACVAAAPLAIGIAAAVLATRSGGTSWSWALAGIVAVMTVAAPAAVGTWQHRTTRPVAGSGRGDVVTPRRSARRLVAELTVAAALAGGAAALRLRGLGAGAGIDPYLSSVPVLVAMVAAVIAARAYPVPLRAVLPLAARRRTAVSYLGLASVARSRQAPLLPAMALVVAIAVVALSGTVQAAMRDGQVAASWRQVGADVVIQAQGGRAPTVTAAAQRAVARVPGVAHAVAAYQVQAGSPIAGTLVTGSTSVAVGVLIVDPGEYAALTSDTPWHSFPSASLARPPRGTGALPVIASPRIAALIRRGGTELDFGSSPLALHVAGVVASTPAFPGGGPFLIMPRWEAARLRAPLPPTVMLVTGTGINGRALRAAVRRTLPGAQIISRAAVLRAQASSPLLGSSRLLFLLGLWAAACCSAASVILAMGLARRERAAAAARLAALGMTGGQVRAMALLQPLPLLLTAIIGGELAGLALAPLIGPALDLSAFTGSAAPVPVRPDAFALLAPAAGLVLLVAALAVTDTLLARRTRAAAALRIVEET